MHEAVRQLALSLPDGATTKKHPCPECGGGGSKDRNFYITRESGLIKFICFRVKCNYKGAVRDNPNNEREFRPPALPTNPFLGRTTSLPDRVVDFLYDKYKRPPSCHWLFDPDNNRVVFPLRSVTGYPIGNVSRGYRELDSSMSGKKSIVYWDVPPTEPRIHFEKIQLLDSATVVVVEDVISAYAVAEFANCVSILGTHLGSNHINYFRRRGVERLLFYLDEDAISKAVSARDKYNLVFPKGCGVIPCYKGLDPKDTSDNELQLLLRREIGS